MSTYQATTCCGNRSEFKKNECCKLKRISLKHTMFILFFSFNILVAYIVVYFLGHIKYIFLFFPFFLKQDVFGEYWDA